MKIIEWPSTIEVNKCNTTMSWAVEGKEADAKPPTGAVAKPPIGAEDDLLVEPQKIKEPPLSNLTYVVTLQSVKSGLGIELKRNGSSRLIVVGVKEMAVARWNRANPNAMVKPGDELVNVNGMQANVLQLFNELGKVGTVTLVMRRPLEYTISIKKDGEPVGLRLKRREGIKELFVEGVLQGRCLQWNQENPDTPVEACDDIVAVNGNRDPECMMRLIMAEECLDLTIQHYVS